MITIGMSDCNQEREYMIHDQRKMGTPLRKAVLDNNSQVMFSHYDEINNLFYITNKGSNFTSIFYFSDTGESADQKPQLVPLQPYNAKDGTTYMYFLPKHHINPNNKELQRAIRTTGKRCEYISFRLPRKEASFSLDLYPYFKSKTAALTWDEWASGKNENPIFDNWNPKDLDSQMAGRKTVAFNKKHNDSLVMPKEQNMPRGTVAVKKSETIDSPADNNKASEDMVAIQQETIHDLQMQLTNCQQQLKESESTVDEQKTTITTLEQQIS